MAGLRGHLGRAAMPRDRLAERSWGRRGSPVPERTQRPTRQLQTAQLGKLSIALSPITLAGALRATRSTSSRPSRPPMSRTRRKSECRLSRPGRCSTLLVYDSPGSNLSRLAMFCGPFLTVLMDRPDGRKAALQVFGAPTPDFSLPCPELSYWPSPGRAASNLAISTRMSAKSVVRGPNRKQRLVRRTSN